MIKVTVKDSDLRLAAEEGMDAFVGVFLKALHDKVGEELTAETMAQLNVSQITLMGYEILQREVMDGGIIQLIHNGYGGFIFLNPFAKLMRDWGLRDLAKMLFDCKKLYNKYHEQIECECTDEEFMAMFEKFPEFDDFDDEFVENEEQFTAMIAAYVDDHIEVFAEIVNE